MGVVSPIQSKRDRLSSYAMLLSPATPTSGRYLRLLTLICAVLIGGALLALALLTLLHAELAHLAAFDSAIFATIHTWTSPLLTAIMVGLSKIGAIGYFASSLFVVVLLLLYRTRIHPAALMTGAVLGAFAQNESLKLHFHRARPVLPWALAHERTFSFPSGHALFATAFYGALAYVALLDANSASRRIAILVPAFVLPLAIGLSRIYLGVHYPSDVLAGYIAGGSWLAGVIAADRIWLAAQREEHIFPTQES